MKSNNSTMIFALLLMLAMSGCSTKPAPVSVPPISVVKLYGMPEVIGVTKGTEISTTDGILVVPADTNLWSHGAYMKLLEETLKD